MQNCYLSQKAASGYSISTLFFQPFCEVGTNVKKTFESEKIIHSFFSPKGIAERGHLLLKRVSHLVVATFLMCPLLNTITMLFLRLFNKQANEQVQTTATVKTEIPPISPSSTNAEPVDSKEILEKIITEVLHTRMGNQEERKFKTTIKKVLLEMLRHDQCLSTKDVTENVNRNLQDSLRSELKSKKIKLNMIRIDLIGPKEKNEIDEILALISQEFIQEFVHASKDNLNYNKISDTVDEIFTYSPERQDLIDQHVLQQLQPLIDLKMRRYVKELNAFKQGKKATINFEEIKLNDYVYQEMNKSVQPPKDVIEAFALDLYFEAYSVSIIDSLPFIHPVLSGSSSHSTDSNQQVLIDAVFSDLNEKFGAIEPSKIPEIGALTLNRFIHMLIARFLEPYFTGKITPDNEPQARIALMDFIKDQLVKFGEVSIPNLEDIVYKEYIKQAIYGLYRSVLPSFRNPKTCYIDETSKFFEQLIRSLRCTLPKDFPNRAIDENKLRSDVIELLSIVNQERHA